MVLLPQPDGPAIRPMFHGRSSSGSEAVHWSREVFSAARSNMPRICAIRGDSTMGDSTVMVACMEDTSAEAAEDPRFALQPFLLEALQQLDLRLLVATLDEDEKLFGDVARIAPARRAAASASSTAAFV